MPRIVFPELSRQVSLPKESRLPRMVLPLLSRYVVLPNESVEPRTVLPELSRQVSFPKESRLPRKVLPEPSRQVVFPNESVEHRVWAVTSTGNKATPSAIIPTKAITADWTFMYTPLLHHRLQKRIPGILVKLDINLGGHIV